MRMIEKWEKPKCLHSFVEIRKIGLIFLSVMRCDKIEDITSAIVWSVFFFFFFTMTHLIKKL